MSKRRNTAEAAAETTDPIAPPANQAEGILLDPPAAAASSQAEPSTGSPANLNQPTTESPQQRQHGDEPEEKKRPYNPVRGWTSRLTGPVKYRKFTDDKMKIIAFKFDVAENQKLPDDVLAVMRENKVDSSGHPTGLKYQVSRKHGKIWTIPNDVEGRMLADKIDFRLSEIAEKTQATPGKDPF